MKYKKGGYNRLLVAQLYESNLDDFRESFMADSVNIKDRGVI